MGGGSGGGQSVFSPATVFFTLTTPPSTDTTFAAPTALQLTPNDGWLVLNFMGNANADGYTVSRCTQAQPQVCVALPVGNPGPSSSPTWADNVGDTQGYCYKAKSLKQQADGSWVQSEDSTEICGQAAANDAKTAYTEKSDATMGLLDNQAETFSSVIEPPPLDQANRPPTTWEDVYRSLNPLVGSKVPILFGNMYAVPTDSGSTITLGAYDPSVKAIVLNARYSDAPPALLAAILAHEGLHQMWDKDWDTGGKLVGRPPADWVPPADFVAPRSFYSQKQEYNSMVGGDQVWNVLQNTVGSVTGNAVELLNMLKSQMGSFLNQGVPVPFTSDSVTQYFSSIPSYANLLEY
jgi:hypothetical protein